MARYLFHTLTAAACLAMVAGPNVCFAADGADAGGGAAPKTKAKAKDAAPAPAPAAAAEPAPADAGGGAAAPAEDAAVVEEAPAVEAAPEAPSLADPASLGFAKVRHPGGATSVSHGGQVYEADKAGNITVPLTAVEDLVSHGFELV